ncbi:GNAT family N-acetyltransferase [Erythrobacter sp. JK5]|uniref:GNAT family N-acetyltransferase n=1 Tax=Erythrobacter sp. JK5 TaxID=2829500 RepID=UPI001BA90B67|nr:GNAT family N-acetyltransferase [Erythrobacter sp. JK5]QUL37568.1 GNAT family N-acetyltransferase [Erythrobacter sp. JK5]
MIAVRRLGPGDLAGYRTMNAVFSEVFEEPENYADRPPGDSHARAWLANANNIAILAEAGGKTVGALAGYVLPKFEQERSELFIYDLAVRESHRRRGAATAMIEETRKIARNVGAWTVFVQADTTPEDEPAQALYRKLASSEITALHFDIAP